MGLRTMKRLTQQDLSPADVTAICSIAQLAWDNAANKTRQVHFTWNGHKLHSTLTSFRILVWTSDHKPLCCRYQ